MNLLGNAPAGHLKQSKSNAKIYFFKAQLQMYKNLPNDIDHVWVNKSELKNFIKSEDYLKAVEKFLLDF